MAIVTRQEFAFDIRQDEMHLLAEMCFIDPEYPRSLPVVPALDELHVVGEHVSHGFLINAQLAGDAQERHLGRPLDDVVNGSGWHAEVLMEPLKWLKVGLSAVLALKALAGEQDPHRLGMHLRVYERLITAPDHHGIERATVRAQPDCGF